MTDRLDDDLGGHLDFEVVPPPLSPAMDAELAALKPVATRRPRRQLAIFLVIAGVVFAAVLAALGVRADVHQLPVAWMPMVASLWILGLVAAAWSSIVPRAGSMMPRWRFASLIALATSGTYVVLGLALHPSGPSSLHYGWERFVRGHGCLELGLATALVPVIAGRWFLRGAAPVRARWIAAAVGAAGGCAGGLLLHFYCKIADGPHIGLIHGGVVGVAAIISALVVPRTTSPRS